MPSADVAPVQVTVTGAAGQIGYALLFRIASGQLLGPDQPVVLRLLEIEPAMQALEGVAMELDDCAFPAPIRPRGHLGPQAGVRRHLLGAARGIGAPQGGDGAAGPAEHQRRDLPAARPGRRRARGERRTRPRRRQSLQHQLPDRPEQRTRRPGRALVRDDPSATRTGRSPSSPGGPGCRSPTSPRLGVWGNHSTTQYPDFAHARIGGRPVPEVITDHDWLRGEFVTTVQKRGAAVIEARGSSSAASAANAVVDSVASIRTPTDRDDWVSLAVPSSGEYGVPEGLQFGYPVRSTGSSWEVAAGLEHDELRPGPHQDHDRGAPRRAGRGGRAARLGLLSQGCSLRRRRN